MKFLIAFSCLLALAYANENANILKNEAEVNVENFHYLYELDNSAKAEQSGSLEGENWVVKGDYGWTSPEGENVGIQYVANENGVQILSANPPLPTPHPIPSYILKAIDYINAHPHQEEH